MDRDGAKKREKKKISEEGEALANKEEESRLRRGREKKVKETKRGHSNVLKPERIRLKQKSSRAKNENFKDQMVQNIELNSHEEKEKNTHTRNAIL